MASTWSALKIELLETGANSGTWGTATNVNLGDAILGEAITGQATVDFSSDADVTITLTDSATSQAARNLRLNITESSTGVGSVRNLILGSGCQIEKFYLINNTGTGAKTVKNTSGTGISVPAGKATLVYNNGTNVVDAASYFSSLTLGSALPVASGGTSLSTLTANNVILGNGTSAPLFVAPSTTGNVLTSNGTTWQSSAPAAGGIVYTAVKTANYTAVANDGVQTNTTSGAFTVTLPSTPATGTQVFVADSAGTWGTNNLTIGRNGSTIEGSATDLVCDINGVNIQCVYNGTTWDIYAQVGANDTAVVTLNGTQTLTNKTLTAPTITSPTITGTGAIAAATVTLSSTLSVTGVSTLTDGAVVQGLTVGRGAGAVTSNTAVGANALGSSNTGGNNTAIGSGAMGVNTSGAANVSVGDRALTTNTTGDFNSAVGVFAMRFNTTGASNTGFGTYALYSNTTASNNTAVGYQAGYVNTTGNITAFGAQALSANTTGARNVGIGGTTGGTGAALSGNTTGNDNVAVGNALIVNTTGSSNTAVGSQALTYNTASNNTAVGYQAGYSNTTGSVTAFGQGSLYSNVTGDGNSAFGVSSLTANTGNYNSALGWRSGYSNTSGTQNAFFGYAAAYANTTGGYNLAIGNTAMYTNTTGSYNVALGVDSLRLNTTASYNTAVGYQAGYTNTTGERNTAVGYQALYTSTTASNNTAVGHWAAKGATTGGLNTCVGDYAGVFLTTGSSNICIGALAGYNQNVGPVTTGGANILIGNDTGLAASSNNHCININTVGAAGKGTSTGFINPNGGGVYQGNNSSSWSTTSDQRLKKNIVDNNIGLDAIASIRVRNFEYRVESEITELPTHAAIKKSGVQLGVIAQELQAVLPECVKTESTGVMSVDTDNLTWYLINAVKELKAEVDSLKSQLQGN